MAGNQTVKDLDKKSTVTEVTFQYFPMWYFKRRTPDGKETVMLEPAAAISVSELRKVSLPAGDLRKYNSSLYAQAVSPTVPLEAALQWQAERNLPADVAGAPSPTPPATTPAAAAAQNTAHLEGQRVAAVRAVSESGEVLLENPAELAQQAGESYRSEAVRESLRQLNRSGRYADIRAEASPTAGGVRLDFVVVPSFYINSVHVEGLKEPPGEGQALDTVKNVLTAWLRGFTRFSDQGSPKWDIYLPLVVRGE